MMLVYILLKVAAGILLVTLAVANIPKMLETEQVNTRMWDFVWYGLISKNDNGWHV